MVSSYSLKIFLLLGIASYCRPDPVRPYEPSQSLKFPERERGQGTKNTRSNKSFVFPESSRYHSQSGFRPGKALNFPEAANFDVLRHESFPSVTTTTESFIRTTTKVPEPEIPLKKAEDVEAENLAGLAFRNPEGKQSVLTESDVVEAMETLVDRLDSFEIRMNSIENSLVAFEQRAVAVEDLSLVKRELDDGMATLLERNIQLEKQMHFLEEFYRERTNPKLLVTTTATVDKQSSDDRNHCPADFFSLNHSDPSSPCYHISSEDQHRKNWQEAVSSCQKIGAKLAEPQSADELRLLTNYLLTRSNQIGGGYWTGGINPGLLWLWSISGNPVSNFPAEFWFASPENNSHQDEVNTNCLRLSYDRNLLRYALEGSECQRYLYFVCEYNADHTTQGRSSNLLLKLLLQSSETSTTNTPEFTTTSTPETTVSPVSQPNYVGVVGFKTSLENGTVVHSGSNLTVFNS